MNISTILKSTVLFFLFSVLEWKIIIRSNGGRPPTVGLVTGNA
jgi:hypothetical protein